MMSLRWLAAGVISTVGVVGSTGGVTNLTGRQSAPVAPPSTTLTPSQKRDAATLVDVENAYHVVLRNLANARTPGYRAVRPLFEAGPGNDQVDTGIAPPPRMLVTPNPGWPQPTGRPLDLLLDGPGFFQFREPSAPGGTAYGRVGHLIVDSEQFLAGGQPGGPARRLVPPVAVPEAAHALRVLPTGIVQGLDPATATWIDLGEIHLADFLYPDRLHESRGLLHATPGAGAPRTALPGDPGLATLQSGILEGSNVDLAVEAEQVRFLRAWSKRLADALGRPDPLAGAPLSGPSR